MKNFKNLLSVALFLIAATVIGQTKISGTIVDESNEGLPGAIFLLLIFVYIYLILFLKPKLQIKALVA